MAKQTKRRKRIFVLQPFRAEFDQVFHLVTAAAEHVDAEVTRLDQVAVPGLITEALYEAIRTSDLIICDITHLNPNIMYELGFAHGVRKPVIIISQFAEVTPFDIRSVRIIRYETTFGTELVRSLQTAIEVALRNPEMFSSLPRTEKTVSTVFVSYSHTDSEFLNRLRIHLMPLEKQGLLELWDDSKLDAGDQWKATVEEALGRARVAILLVSADFLASDFIVDNELPPLLVKAETEGTRIISVIVKPCRFRRDEKLSRFQAINDPTNPLISMSEGEQEKIYDALSQLVERHMHAPRKTRDPSTPWKAMLQGLVASERYFCYSLLLFCYFFA
jgi:hypothetical protein